mgnify:CR=1 FL=1|eukprot:scaffold227719_cov24-Tisochrysis_lutea.AAC.1
MSTGGGGCSSSDLLEYTCDCLWDGQQRTVLLRPSERLATLCHRLAPSLAPSLSLKLCCDGEFCPDLSAPLSSLRGRTLTAWLPRYSRHVSDAAAACAAAAAQARAHYEANRIRIEARKLLRHTGRMAVALAADARAGVPRVRRGLACVPLRMWGKLALWSGLTLLARELGLGMPFLIVAAIYAIFSNLGVRDGGESAYTVFNGMRALPGQLQAEDLQRDLMRGF